MSEAVLKLLPLLDALTPDEQAEIADYLAAQNGELPDLTEDQEREFDATLARRVQELTTGAVRGVPAEEVLERLRKKYPE